MYIEYYQNRKHVTIQVHDIFFRFITQIQRMANYALWSSARKVVENGVLNPIRRASYSLRNRQISVKLWTIWTLLAPEGVTVTGAVTELTIVKLCVADEDSILSKCKGLKDAIVDSTGAVM